MNKKDITSWVNYMGGQNLERAYEVDSNAYTGLIKLYQCCDKDADVFKYNVSKFWGNSGKSLVDICKYIVLECKEANEPTFQ